MDVSRTAVVGVALALVVLSAGCLGVLTGSEPFVATASDVGVDDAALAETGFETADERTAWVNRTVDVAGQEREVRIRNAVATYRHPPELGVGSIEFGFVSLVSTPQVEIAGQALNPIGRMSHAQLVEQAASQSGGLQSVEREGTVEVSLLGSTTEATRFSAVVERGGQEFPVYVEVVRVEDGEDYVIAVGVYPQGSSEMRGQVHTLFDAVQH